MSKPDLDGEGCAWMFMKLIICAALVAFALGILFTVVLGKVL